MLKLLATILFTSALAGAAIAHEKHGDTIPVATAASMPASTSLAARFELRVNKRTTDWYLWREADTIETANIGSGRGEIWQRLGDGGYGYRRVFHQDRKVVEYSSGELKTRNAEPDWNQLGSVVAPQVLDGLKRSGSRSMFGQKAVRYVGRLGDSDIDLWWLEESRLPARLERKAGGQRITLLLRELKARAPASWIRADESRTAGYGLVDAADFGDMESDPFVARVLQEDGHRHGPAH